MGSTRGGIVYAFSYDVPGDGGIYRRVNAVIGDEPAKGLIVLMVVKRDGGLRHFGVWESKELFDRFQQERVGPAVAGVLSSLGVNEPPPPPEVEELALVDLITG
jgi:hypothetical protein